MNYKALIEEALKTMVRGSDYEFFFKELTSHEWIDALKETKQFEKPEKIRKQGEGISFPVWPQSQYLARVADKAPKKVMDIMLETETDNPRIHQDFIEAATKMPVEEAKRFTKKLIKWLNTADQYIFNYSSQIPDYVLHLKKGGADKEAFTLTDTLLSIREPSEEDKDKLSALRKAKPILRNAWEYDEAIKKLAPLYQGKDRIKLIEILSYKLKDSLDAEGRDKYDYSQIWRESIENAQSHRESIKDSQVTWIKDLSEQLISEHPEFLTCISDILIARNSAIFRRIVLHISKKSENIEIIEQVLLDDSFFDDPEAWTEYAYLLRDFFKLISPEKQQLLLKKIIELKSRHNRKSPEEFDEKSNDQAKYNYLHLIKDSLEGEAKELYRSIIEKHEKLAPPFYYRSSKTGGWYGPNSPLKYEDLKEMSVESIQAFLDDWEPTGKWQDPSIEGLARDLEKIVSERVDEFALALDLFKLEEKTYVRSIIDGLKKGIADKGSINWEQIVDYLNWTCKQKDETPPKKYSPQDERDPGWGWAKKSACRMIALGFDEGPKQLPLSLRAKAWTIIESGLQDSDPDIEREKDTKDYYHVGINSTRGETLDSALHYAFWVKRNLGYIKQALPLEVAPEFFTAIANLLKVEKEPTKAIRSIFGKWLPWIMNINKEWFDDIKDLILPTDEALRDYWEAAWYSNLLYNQSYTNVFENLSSHYLLAIERMDVDEAEDEEKIDSRLTDHIIAIYLFGGIELDSELINKLYDKVNLKLKRHIIWLAGRIISRDNEKEEIDKNIVERAKALWNYRLGVTSTIKDIKERSELARFGDWIDSPFLEDEWVLNQLILAIRACHSITPDFVVLDRLIVLAPSYPEKVAEVLLLIVEHKISDYSFYGWIDKSKELLPLLVNNPNSKANAIKTIQRLGAYGYQEFKDFLPKD